MEHPAMHLPTFRDLSRWIPLCGILAPTASAQVQFSGPIVLSTTTDFAYGVSAGDVDNDGDIDVVSSSSHDSEITLFRNLGGGVFGGDEILTDKSYYSTSVKLADLDGDGDLDLLHTGAGDDEVSIHENDGGGDFGSEEVLGDQAVKSRFVWAGDLDNDGDLDVMAASFIDNTVAWYENLGGLNFSSERIIDSQAMSARCVMSGDLDGDGLEDVLAAAPHQNQLVWYRNLSGGQFSGQNVITSNANVVIGCWLADLDGDGDLDAVSGCNAAPHVAWYANDGAGNFGPQQVVTSQAINTRSVHAADLDGDGDLDLLSGSWIDGKVAWYENLDGLGTFGPQLLITDQAAGCHEVWAADLDGDGDLDVMSASSVGDLVAWYENLGDPQELYCTPATPGPSGASVTLGSSSRSGPLLHHLEAMGGPFNEFGYFLVSATAVDPGVPLAGGSLCLGAPFGRYATGAGNRRSVGRFDASGAFQNLSGTSSVGTGFDVPIQLPSPPGGVIATGTTWNFQLWYRDGSSSAFSDGLSVQF